MKCLLIGFALITAIAAESNYVYPNGYISELLRPAETRGFYAEPYRHPAARRINNNQYGTQISGASALHRAAPIPLQRFNPEIQSETSIGVPIAQAPAPVRTHPRSIRVQSRNQHNSNSNAVHYTSQRRPSYASNRALSQSSTALITPSQMIFEQDSPYKISVPIPNAGDNQASEILLTLPIHLDEITQNDIEPVTLRSGTSGIGYFYSPIVRKPRYY